jgi:hypothetical protein
MRTITEDQRLTPVGVGAPVVVPAQRGSHRPAGAHRPAAQGRSRRRPGRRALLLIGLGLGVLLFLAAGARLAWHATHLQRDAAAADSALSAVQAALDSGDPAAGPLALAQAQRAAARAEADTAGPLWRSAAAIPYLGRNLRTSRGLTVAVDRLARHGLPALLGTEGAMQPGSFLRMDGSLDLVPLRNASAPLGVATAEFEAARRSIAALPSTGLVGPVADARRSALAELDQSLSPLRAASIAARVVPSMLGTDGDRRYLVTLRTPSARGAGTKVRAFVALDVVGQRLSVEGHGPAPAGLGSRIDGSVDLDGTAMAALVTSLGSVLLPVGSVTADTVPNVLNIAGPGDADLLRTTLNMLVNDPTLLSQDLFRQLGAAAAGGHLTLNSAHPAEQAALRGTSLTTR